MNEVPFNCVYQLLVQDDYDVKLCCMALDEFMGRLGIRPESVLMPPAKVVEELKKWVAIKPPPPCRSERPSPSSDEVRHGAQFFLPRGSVR